ncbi:helix-turn-helix transcriptional regulator [Halobaculum gomorrense]|uniref:Predicted transcriptional regulator, contains HTH domain n=1 Tax=Halobaculum gomorrense TaxID=43928 RepID=A0A1M5JG02_9EURY|nr:transcriptional regulator FilR1 domain-containing protein [Halobaculum gomorrense]SHG39477.1 Predicted transcriptional regulator, contains HTH domain [Halobaculum gomorrense]
MDSALEEIEFLALSANRVTVLERLAAGPHTRRDLVEATGASQPTLGRILRDFADRRWIIRDDDGGEYCATATGRLVAAEFTSLRETVETERRLREVVEWLPTEALGFDLRRLADARITRPSRTRPGAPVGRVLDLLRDADRVRIVSHAFNEGSLDAIRERAVAGELTFEGVFSRTALDAVARDAGLGADLRELIAAEGVEIRLHDGPVPLAVTITDDVVHLLLRDDEGLLRAAVDTDDDAVREWAAEAHERYWREGELIDPGTLDDAVAER